MMQVSKLRIGILGLGQIGGSIAVRLSSLPEYRSIIGYDLKPELHRTALIRQIVTEVAESEIELVAASEVVIIALPIGEIIEFLKRQRDNLLGQTAILDTGTVKQEIMAVADELRLVNFVGGHPLAGTERRGADSWNGELFEAASFFLSRGLHTIPDATAAAEDIVRSLGANPILIDPDHHDRLIAVTSHLAHLAAYAMTHTYRDGTLGSSDKHLFRSPSFLSATRVANSDQEMVFHMLWHNRRHVAGGLALFLQQLRLAQDAIEREDAAGFRRFLDATDTHGDSIL
jgi:prephenate dehydrogenase